MSTLAFYLLVTLTAAKAYPELRTRAPFEWAGELAAMIVSLVVGGVGAGALWVVGH